VMAMSVALNNTRRNAFFVDDCLAEYTLFSTVSVCVFFTVDCLAESTLLSTMCLAESTLFSTMSLCVCVFH